MFLEFSEEALYRAMLLYCYSFLSTRNTSALVRHFKTAKNAWNSSLNELLRAGLQEITGQRLIESRTTLSPKNIAEELHEKEIKIIKLEDQEYPPLLKHIYDAPPALFCRGTLTPNTFSHAVAVVGSRKITPYGHQIINHIIPSLVHSDITIVSGLALGTDGYAHTISLDSNGTTVAFLGSGIDDLSIYPKFHTSLARRIISNGGALLSEFPPGTLPLRHHFPVRNRLIAGSTLGTLVTEASEDSGSLITARLSLECGREVWAIPGQFHSPLSIGPNKLIQMGARLVLNAEDIITDLNLQEKQKLPLLDTKMPLNNFSPDEQKILSCLKEQPLHIDVIISLSALESRQAVTALSMLEINGYIKNIGNLTYVQI